VTGQHQQNEPGLHGDMPQTSSAACAAFREAGLDLSPEQVCIEAREDCWLASLPGDRLAWFAANARGRERLNVARRVLCLLAERCGFRVPRVLFESDRGWDLRAAVPGSCDPWGLYRHVRNDVPLARRIGRAIGSIVAEQHTRISYDDVAAWLPAQPDWPEPTDWVRQRIPDVIDDRDLLSRIGEALDAYDACAVSVDDKVLVHGDLGLHNLAVDPETNEVRGVFDYSDASWADRHHDFRYVQFDHECDGVLEAALAVYEPAVARVLNRDRIRLYNAVCASCFLALRRDLAPEQRSCGRTLAEDLRWVRTAHSSL